jgi:hypothetical protein
MVSSLSQSRLALKHTLWLFNIQVAMENGPFIEYFPIESSIYKGFSMAMIVITRW